MTPLTTLAMAGCLALGAGSDQILLRDLASAFSGAQELPLDAVVSLAPAPGVERRFEIAELRRIALRLNLPEPRGEVCVERPVAPLDPAPILAAMQAQLPAARIELLDYSRHPMPEGAPEFPLTGLRQAAAGAFWSGSIRYGGVHRLAIWARVNVSLRALRVVAVGNLSPGRALESSALRVETRDEFPSADAFPVAIEEVVGKVLRRPVRSGTAIRSAWLEASKAVTRGDTVQVEAREGAALVQLPGQAQGSGAIGQTVLVLNPMSNKRFPARVEGRGRVSVGKGSE